MMGTIVWAAACLVLPQEEVEAREPGFGIVRKLDGSPWVDAEVHLLHRPHSEVLDEAVADRLTVRSDARGRFRVQMLRGASYAVWARQAGDTSSGTVRVSGLLEAATPRTPIQLREVEAVQVRRLRLDVDESWGEQPGFRLYASTYRTTGSATERAWLEPEEEGVYRLPVWWDALTQVDVYRDGWMVRRSWFSARGEAAANPRALTVPARWTRTVRFVDEVTGRPVAGAVARPCPEPPGLEAPRSDAEGCFEVLACDDPRMGKREIAYYAVHAPGLAERSFVVLHGKEGISRRIQRSMAPGYAVSGQLLLQGEPLPGVPIVVQSEVRQELFNQWLPVPDRIVHTDSEGRFTVPSRSDPAGHRLVAVLPRAVLDRLARGRVADVADAPPFSQQVVLETATLETTRDRKPDLGALELADFRAVDVLVGRPDRQPAAAVPVVLGGRATGDGKRTFERGARRSGVFTRYRADRHGRVRFLVDDPRDLVVVSGDPAHGLGWVQLEAAGASEVSLPLLRRNSVLVRALDPDGHVVDGAQVSGRVLGQIGGTFTIAAGAAVKIAEKNPSVELEVGHMVRQLLAREVLQPMYSRVDSEGLVRLLAPMWIEGTVDLRAHASGRDGAGSRSGHRTVPIPEDHDPDLVYEIQVDG